MLFLLAIKETHTYFVITPFSLINCKRERERDLTLSFYILLYRFNDHQGNSMCEYDTGISCQ